MFGDRPGAQHPSSARARTPNVCVLGKLPSRPDFVHYGLHEEPERVFRAWLEHAVLIAGGVLPNRAVRFIAAPRRTPVFGVWIPSQDSLGRAFPLVFVRRLSKSDVDPRHTQREPRTLGDLPWTLLVAGCSHYLTAAESCLMLGRAHSVSDLWSRLEALPMPSRRDLTELWVESKRALDFEQLDVFARRNLSEAATSDQFVSAVRRLRSDDCNPSQDSAPMLALPADNELDLFAWLELLRVQRAPEATPKALFWSPADRRALVSLGAPLPGTLAFLRQPRAKSVHRLPVPNEPDESPAVEAELRHLITLHPTLAKLRAALAPMRDEEPPAAATSESSATATTTEPPARAHAPVAAAAREASPWLRFRRAQARENYYEPPPTYKFRCVPAPDSHFMPEELRQYGLIERNQRGAAEHQPEVPAFDGTAQRPADAPRTQPLADDFVPEKQTRAERVEAAAAKARAQLRFRIPDPPINLSDTDAIEYVCSMVRERDRVEDELRQAERNRECAQQEIERAAARREHSVLEHPAKRGEESYAAHECSQEPKHGGPDVPLASRELDLIREESGVRQRELEIVRLEHDLGSGARDTHAIRQRELEIERIEQGLRARAHELSLQQRALHERELDLRRQEHALRARVHAVLRHAPRKHAAERNLLDQEPQAQSQSQATPQHATHAQYRANAGTPLARNRSEPAAVFSAFDPRANSPVRIEPITLIDDGSIAAARVLMSDSHDSCRSNNPAAASHRRIADAVTLVDDGSIAAARVLMSDSRDPSHSQLRIVEPVTSVDDGAVHASRVLIIEDPHQSRSRHTASRAPRSLASC
jgi:type VI secretion system protein ImpM